MEKLPVNKVNHNENVRLSDYVRWRNKTIIHGEVQVPLTPQQRQARRLQGEFIIKPSIDSQVKRRR